MHDLPTSLLCITPSAMAKPLGISTHSLVDSIVFAWGNARSANTEDFKLCSMKNWAFKESPCVSISEIVTLTSTKEVLYFYFHSNIYVGFIF